MIFYTSNIFFRPIKIKYLFVWKRFSNLQDTQLAIGNIHPGIQLSIINGEIKKNVWHYPDTNRDQRLVRNKCLLWIPTWPSLNFISSRRLWKPRYTFNTNRRANNEVLKHLHSREKENCKMIIVYSAARLVIIYFLSKIFAS